MATKKPLAKKVTAKKTAAKAAVKKPIKKVAKKLPIKKQRTKLIGLAPETEPFMTFRISRQTVYWAVLGVVVILFTSWILQLQMDIQALYDEIDAANTSTVEK